MESGPGRQIELGGRDHKVGQWACPGGFPFLRAPVCPRLRGQGGSGREELALSFPLHPHTRSDGQESRE